MKEKVLSIVICIMLATSAWGFVKYNSDVILKTISQTNNFETELINSNNVKRTDSEEYEEFVKEIYIKGYIQSIMDINAGAFDKMKTKEEVIRYIKNKAEEFYKKEFKNDKTNN